MRTGYKEPLAWLKWAAFETNTRRPTHALGAAKDSQASSRATQKVYYRPPLLIRNLLPNEGFVEVSLVVSPCDWLSVLDRTRWGGHVGYRARAGQGSASVCYGTVSFRVADICNRWFVG